MKKIQLILTASLILFSLLLTGCTQDATEIEPTQEETVAEDVVADEVTITFWHTYSENSSENDMLVNTLIPIFEEQHPNQYHC